MINNQKIKEHFDSKTTLPSAESWDKLSFMLDKNDTKTTKKINYYKYTAVACLLIFGLIIWQFSNQEVQNIPTQEVVIETNSSQKTEELEKNEFQEIEIKKELKNNPKELVSIEKRENKTEKFTKINAITPTDFKNEILENKNTIANQTTLEINQNKPLNQKNENNEELIIIEKSIETKTLVTINPDLLLQAAEKDLDIEHRDKTLLKLKDGYNQVKAFVLGNP